MALLKVTFEGIITKVSGTRITVKVVSKPTQPEITLPAASKEVVDKAVKYCVQPQTVKISVSQGKITKIELVSIGS